jgi:Tol biopolymer transport system component
MKRFTLHRRMWRPGALSLAFALSVIAQAQPDTGRVTIRDFTRFGGRVDWSADGIVFDHLDADGYYDVAFIRQDGSGYRNLTKGRAGVPQKHCGNPAWHPTGRYVVFVAEKDERLHASDAHIGGSAGCTPGAGAHCDLWVADLRDTSFTRLTTLPTKKNLPDPTKISGVLHPHFSHDGKKLLWSEMTDFAGSGARGTFGLWRLNVSDFVTTGGTPFLANTARYEPGGALGPFSFIETHGFSPDDSTVIYCANAQAGQQDVYIDIYTFNLFSRRLRRLTDEADVWDEHAHISPDGRRVVWMSSAGYPVAPSTYEQSLKTEYWMMDIDGSNKTRLTFFNDPASSDARVAQGGRAIASDFAWGTLADRFLDYIQVIDSAGGYHQEDKFIVIRSLPSDAPNAPPPPSRMTLRVFPNPCSGVFTVERARTAVEAGGSVEPLTLTLTDALGRVVPLPAGAAALDGERPLTVDGSRLAPGMYILSATGRRVQAHATLLRAR